MDSESALEETPSNSRLELERIDEMDEEEEQSRKLRDSQLQFEAK